MTDKKVISRESIDLGRVKNRPGYRQVLMKELVEIQKQVPHGNTKWEFSEAIQNLICDSIQEGMTMAQIAAIPGMPPRRHIYVWMEKHEAFKEAYAVARKYRAEHYHDEVIKEAMDTDEDNSKAQKVKIDALKWAAKVNDPLIYGDIKKEVGDAASGGINIFISTGIDRTPIAEIEAVDVTPKEEANGED